MQMLFPEQLGPVMILILPEATERLKIKLSMERCDFYLLEMSRPQFNRPQSNIWFVTIILNLCIIGNKSVYRHFLQNMSGNERTLVTSLAIHHHHRYFIKKMMQISRYFSPSILYIKQAVHGQSRPYIIVLTGNQRQ